MSSSASMAGVSAATWATGDSSMTEVSAVAIGLSMPKSVQRADSRATTVRLI